MSIVREDKMPNSTHVGTIQIAQMGRIQVWAFHLPETREKIILNFSKYSSKERNLKEKTAAKRTPLSLT